MDQNLFCPQYVDFVRECCFTFGTISQEMDTTLRFCISGNFADCPFFRALDNPPGTCEYFTGCPLCEHYKKKDLHQFVEMTNKWCLKNFCDCARHKLKKAGDIPDKKLHPDGSLLPE